MAAHTHLKADVRPQAMVIKQGPDEAGETESAGILNDFKDSFGGL
jgi:hypothetical protein